MSFNTTKLSKLSRYKSTGNLLVVISFSIGFTFLLSTFGIEASSFIDRFLGFVGSIIFLLLSYLFHKNLRKPFFSAMSQYLTELTDRRLDTQQVAVQADLIEPLQKLNDLSSILKEIDGFSKKMGDILNQTALELELNSPPLRALRIQNELQTIARLAEDSLNEVKKKKDNIIFLAKTRKFLLDTINKRMIQPRNEIEADYLIFRAQKRIKDQFIDDILIKKIITHALEQGEIQGKLQENEEGELVLSLYNVLNPEFSEEISWDNSEQYINHCVICRHAIRSSEPISICPFCENVFHRSHLLEWLKVFNQCPICHEKITLFSNS